MIDTHCHLTDGRFAGNLDGVIDRAGRAGVTAMICATANAADAEAAAALSSYYGCIYFTAGIHPHEAAGAAEADYRKIVSIAGDPRCLAIGEIGLDYHYDFSPRQRQQQVFAEQLQRARQQDARVVIHTREAFDDTMAVLRESGIDMAHVLFHSFTGGPAQGTKILDAGASISFSGIVTFKKASEIRETAALVPDDRILAETDAPYLSPEPVRKIRVNEPANVVHVYRRLAGLRHTPLPEFERLLNANAAAILGLQPS